MFKWFKRQQEAPASARKPKPRPAARPERPLPTAEAEGPPSSVLPEVVAEGNTQADWSMWEDSMTALDSQLQGLGPSSRIQVRETRPSQLDEDDPFSGVREKRR